MSKTRSRSKRTRPSAPRKKKKAVDLGAASARMLTTLSADIRKVLAKHGVGNALTAIHLEPVARRKPATAKARRAAAGPAAAAAAPCGEGEVRRVVCEVREGVLECEERCVPA